MKSRELIVEEIENIMFDKNSTGKEYYFELVGEWKEDVLWYDGIRKLEWDKEDEQNMIHQGGNLWINISDLIYCGDYKVYKVMEEM